MAAAALCLIVYVNSAPPPLLLHTRHFHYTITYTIEYSMIPRARWAGDLQPGVAKMKNEELRSHSGLAWMGTNLVLQTAPPCTAGHHRGVPPYWLNEPHQELASALEWRSGQVTPMPHSQTDRLWKIEPLSSLEVEVELSWRITGISIWIKISA